MVPLLLVILAQGGPPLLTDDPGTPGDGKWEINLALTFEEVEEGGLFEVPLIDLNYGLGERMQLKLEIPWLVLDDANDSTTTGLGDLVLGSKWRFLDDEKAGVSASVYPQLGLNTVESSADRGLVERGTELFLPMEFRRDFGFLDVNVELGYALREACDDEWVFGVAVGRHLSERFELIGEIHGTSDARLDDADAVFRVGFRAGLTDVDTLLFSVGSGLASAEPDVSVYLGLQLSF
jgi:hypothetical protein